MTTGRNLPWHFLIGRTVRIVFVVLLAVVFVLPALFGSQLFFRSAGEPIYYSPAAPPFSLAVDISSMIGCASLSCIPLIMVIFLLLLYIFAVLIAGLYIGSNTILRDGKF